MKTQNIGTPTTSLSRHRLWLILLLSALLAFAASYMIGCASVTSVKTGQCLNADGSVCVNGVTEERCYEICGAEATWRQ